MVTGGCSGSTTGANANRTGGTPASTTDKFRPATSTGGRNPTPSWIMGGSRGTKAARATGTTAPGSTTTGNTAPGTRTTGAGVMLAVVLPTMAPQQVIGRAKLPAPTPARLYPVKLT